MGVASGMHAKICRRPLGLTWVACSRCPPPLATHRSTSAASSTSSRRAARRRAATSTRPLPSWMSRWGGGWQRAGHKTGWLAANKVQSEGLAASRVQPGCRRQLLQAEMGQLVPSPCCPLLGHPAIRWEPADPRAPVAPLQGVGLKHLTGDVKSILGRITETDQVGRRSGQGGYSERSRAAARAGRHAAAEGRGEDARPLVPGAPHAHAAPRFAASLLPRTTTRRPWARRSSLTRPQVGLGRGAGEGSSLIYKHGRQCGGRGTTRASDRQVCDPAVFTPLLTSAPFDTSPLRFAPCPLQCSR